MEYIRRQCQPKDNKLHAIGHSMGGILLYAMLSQNGMLNYLSYTDTFYEDKKKNVFNEEIIASLKNLVYALYMLHALNFCF